MQRTRVSRVSPRAAVRRGRLGVDVVQADIYWAGGITEMLKICAIASAYDLPVVPHGHSTPASIHVIAAQPEPLTPLVEYLVKWNELLQFFWQEPIKPVNGMISAPERPGFGVDIDPAKIETDEELTWPAVPNMAGSVQVRQ